MTVPVSPDVELALLHIPGRMREALAALFAIDAAMADVVARSTEPALGRIKLAWWREQLEALDERSPPAEPRLAGTAEHLIPRDISGAELAGLETGWATLLDPEVDSALVAVRGAALFRIAGRLLGNEDSKLGDAGALYALTSVGRRGSAGAVRACRQEPRAASGPSVRAERATGDDARPCRRPRP
jgi:15-cis-phytoene synthase